MTLDNCDRLRRSLHEKKDLMHLVFRKITHIRHVHKMHVFKMFITAVCVFVCLFNETDVISWPMNFTENFPCILEVLLVLQRTVLVVKILVQKFSPIKPFVSRASFSLYQGHTG